MKRVMIDAGEGRTQLFLSLVLVYWEGEGQL
jgi:hypothetical protein